MVTGIPGDQPKALTFTLPPSRLSDQGQTQCRRPGLGQLAHAPHMCRDRALCTCAPVAGAGWGCRSPLPLMGLAPQLWAPTDLDISLWSPTGNSLSGG